MFAFPLATVLAASSAQAQPAKPGQFIAVSPTMATSVHDWHPELNPATKQTAPSTPTIGCTCGKSVTQTATSTAARTPTTRTAPAATAMQRAPQGKGSAKPSERAQEIPLASVRR
jgi:hypothetical protein